MLLNLSQNLLLTPAIATLVIESPISIITPVSGRIPCPYCKLPIKAHKYDVHITERYDKRGIYSNLGLKYRLEPASLLRLCHAYLPDRYA